MTTLGSSTRKIPDGTYRGMWGGYVAEFSHGGKSYSVTTVDGIRTPRAPCTVTVRGKSITVTASWRIGHTGEKRARNEEK